MTGESFPTFRDYEILSKIGAGGMGSVWRAKAMTGQVRALKVIHPSLSADADFVRRFRSEAEILDPLGDHPNIVRLYHFGSEPQPGEDREVLYIVMEYVEGIDVARLMRGGDGDTGTGLLPDWSALPILRQVTSAIDFAHQKGVIHRDVKPSNILVYRKGSGPPKLERAQDVKIMDFGIARERSSPGMTKTGVVGTPEYMAPELFQEGSNRGDPQTDVYSLGVTAYEMLTNELPFRAPADTTEVASLVHIAREKLDGDPAPPSQHYPYIKPEVEAIVMRAIARRPADRYASAAELLDALDAEIERQEIEMPELGTSGKRARAEHAHVSRPPAPHPPPRPDVPVAVAVGIWAAALVAGVAAGVLVL